MQAKQARLFTLIDSIVPQVGRQGPLQVDVGLTQLGFDSMALVSLFVELESEFGLSLEQMQVHLHKRCTVASLLELCGAT